MSRIILLLSLIVFPIFADHDGDTAETAQSTPTPTPTPGAGRPETAATPSGSCIREICPLGKGKDYTGIKLSKAREKAQQGILNLPPELTSLFNRLDSAKRKDNANLREQFSKKPKNLPQDPVGTALLNLMFAGSQADKMALKQTERGYAVDEERSRAKLLAAKFSPEIAEWMAKGFAYLYSPQRIAESMYSQNVSPRNFVKWLGNGDERLGVKKVIEPYLKNLALLKSVSPTLSEVLGKNTNLKRIETLQSNLKSGGAFLDADLIDLPSQHTSSGVMEALLPAESPFRGQLRFSPQEIEKSRGTPEQYQANMRQLLTQREQAFDSEFRICKGNYLLQREFLPNAKQLADLEQRIATSKSQLSAKLLSKFSKETSEKLKPFVANFKMYLPPSRQGLDERFEKVLAEKVADSERENKIYETSDATSKETLHALFYWLAMFNPSILSKTESICENLLVEMQPDAMLNGDGISLGALTAGNSEVSAVKTLLHELGHALSFQFKIGAVSMHSAGKYQTTRECLRDHLPAKINPRSEEKINRGDLPVYKVAQTTEEDFADWSAGIVMGETSSNAWCDMMAYDPAKGDWVPEVLAPDPSNSHSSNLFRLLHFETLRGKPLPEACVAVLREAGAGKELKICL